MDILHYFPDEGETGVSLSVRFRYKPANDDDTITVRLIFGGIGRETTVSKIAEDEWQLTSTVPPKASSSLKQIQVVVQVLDETETVFFTKPLGPFTYLPAQPAKPEASDLDVLAQEQRKDRLRRRSPTAQNLWSLDIATSLESMCSNWKPDEVLASRRLVKFNKILDNRRLILTCHAITQEEFNESDAVISCIYRADADCHYVTSVDIIYLLEHLTDDDFPVEEKNRIRRNLEGFRPTVISKHKSSHQAFFKRIMEYENPKPRNIEKDLKVFEWTSLGQALEKIFSKYSWYGGGASPPQVDIVKQEPLPDKVLPRSTRRRIQSQRVEERPTT